MVIRSLIELQRSAVMAVGILSVSIWTFIILMSFINVQIPPSPPLVVVEEPTVGAENSPSPYINTLVVLIILAIGGTTFMAILLYAPRIASYISIVVFGLVSFFSLTLYALLLSYRLSIQIESEITLLCLLVAAVLTWLIRKGSGALPFLSASITAAAGGVLIGSMLPPVTALILLSAISLFDLLMVKKGYLSMLGKKELKDRIGLIKGMIVNFNQLTIGLGDLVFYSILVSNVYFHGGFWPALLSNTGVFIGFSVTLMFLKRHTAVPGLTIPILLGLFLATIGQLFL
jgi:hypothetical protein